MYFLELAQTFEEMEKTSSRLKLIDHLVRILEKTPTDIIDKMIYLIQGRLGPGYVSNELGVAEKLLIKALSLSTGHPVMDILTMYNNLGDLGEVAYKIQEKKLQTTLFHENLTIEKVYETLLKISKMTGAGSVELKLKHIVSLLNNSTNIENKYILKLILGNLRLGIADFTILDAIAIAYTKDKKNRKILESAYNVSSDLGKIAVILSRGTIESLRSIKVSLFLPVRPMLAERVSNAEDALEKMGGECLVEFKIDGERIQIHKKEKKIELFTRNLENVTANFPEIVREFETLGLKDIIAEGEMVGIDIQSNKFLPFQNLMHRKRKYNINEAVIKYPVVFNLFDILYYDGQDKTSFSFKDRRTLLENIFSPHYIDNNESKKNKIKLINQTTVSQVEEIEKFMEIAINNGCEGLMIKNPDSRYRAGAREWAWIKLKREYSEEVTDSVDLVVVGALYGRGRRVGKYGALLLATYDPQTDTFYPICKVGTGFTDEILEEISNSLRYHIIKNKHPRLNSGQLQMDVWFEPSIVIEVTSSEITLSPVYTTAFNIVKTGYGLALRFPKFSGKIRDDKKPEDCTTVEEILEIYKEQLK